MTTRTNVAITITKTMVPTPMYTLSCATAAVTTRLLPCVIPFKIRRWRHRPSWRSLPFRTSWLPRRQSCQEIFDLRLELVLGLDLSRCVELGIGFIRDIVYGLVVFDNVAAACSNNTVVQQQWSIVCLLLVRTCTLLCLYYLLSNKKDGKMCVA